MKKLSITLLKLLFIIALGYWICHDLNITLLQKSFQKFHLFGLLITLIAIFLSDLVISYRWYFLSHFRYSFLSSVEANMLAFFLNIFAPAKLGDLSKIYYMHKKEGERITDVTSLFFIERFFDVIILGFLLLFTALFIVPNRGLLFATFALFAFTLLFFLSILHQKTLFWLLKRIHTRKLRTLLYLLAKATKKSLNPKRASILFFLTLCVWGSYYLNNYLFFLTATNFELTFAQIFIASTLAFAISAIPLTPGGIGTFQAAFIVALGWYGVPKEEALSASLLLQILYILPATLFSLYLLFTKDFLRKKEHVSAP